MKPSTGAVESSWDRRILQQAPGSARPEITVQRPATLILIGVLLVLALVTTSAIIYWFFYALTFLIAVSYFWTRTAVNNLYIRRILTSKSATTGDEIREEIYLTNRGRLPILLIELDDHSTLPGYTASVALDYYDRNHWGNSDTALTGRDPDQDRLDTAPTLRNRVTVRAIFEIFDSNSSVLYTPGELISLNRQYRVQSAVEGKVDDYSVIRATRPIGRRISYAAEGTTSGATADQLRLAGASYPSDFDRYLQLPDTTPQVRELALRFGDIADNPYDVAQQIEFFLRRFPFAIDIPELPPDRDAVDYYLFDLRRGFSDYTASAMAILLRLNDIPARLVTGYVPGFFDEESGAFIVGPEDAHSWVEVYFPGYGWVTFEPSGYRAPVPRFESGTTLASNLEVVDDYNLDELADFFGIDLDSFADSGDFDATAIGGFSSRISSILVVLGGIVAVVAGSFLIFFLFNLLQAQFESPGDGIRRAYRSMLRWARWAGYNLDESRTSMEFADRLSADLYPAGPAGAGGQSASMASIAVSRPPADIARQYTRSAYSDHTLAPADLREVTRAWKRLRPVLLGRIIRRRRR